MAMSGYCDSWASTNEDSTGKGAYYRWSWTATHTSPGLTTIDWTLQGRGRTSTPTWLLNECYITVDAPGPGQIVAMEWGVNQDTGDGTNTSFNHNKSKSWRTPGSFTITHTDAAAVTLTVTMKVAFYNGAGTGRTTTSTITIDANPPQYAIVYDANGGTGAPAAQTKVHDTNLTLSSTQPIKASTFSTSAGTITLTYAANGGSTTPTAGMGTYTDTTTTTYAFNKWNTAANGSGTDYSAGGTYSANAAVTLYAQYTNSSNTSRTSNPTIKTAAAISRANDSVTGYKVIFNSNGSPAAAPAAMTSTKTRRYTFTKWKSSSGTELNANTEYTFSVNNTLTAQWLSGDTNNAITLPAAISRTGYTFDGWNTKADGTGTTYLAGASYTPSAATTLYAKWTKITYTLTLNKGEGVASFSGAGTYDYGTGVTTTATASTGYHLTKYAGTLYDGSGNSEWTSCAGATSHDETWTMNANRTITVYAAKNTYIISYNANGGSGSMPTMECIVGVSYNLNENTFVRAGYKFLGWSTSKNATTATYSDKQAISDLATGGIVTLYAVWQGFTYYITYNSNNGSEEQTSSTHQVGTYSSLLNNTFTYSNYSFLGWSTSSSGSVEYSNMAPAPAELVTTDKQTITLYAIWSEISPWTLSQVKIYAPRSATDSTLIWWVV